MKRKRDDAERARNPSVVRHANPAVCRACAPLLANERKFHAEAFDALARAYDVVCLEVRGLRARLRDAGHDLAALVAEYVAEDERNAAFEETDTDRLLGYFTRAYELGRASKKDVTPPVTP